MVGLRISNVRHYFQIYALSVGVIRFYFKHCFTNVRSSTAKLLMKPVSECKQAKKSFVFRASGKDSILYLSLVKLCMFTTNKKYMRTHKKYMKMFKASSIGPNLEFAFIGWDVKLFLTLLSRVTLVLGGGALIRWHIALLIIVEGAGGGVRSSRSQTPSICLYKKRPLIGLWWRVPLRSHKWYVPLGRMRWMIKGPSHRAEYLPRPSIFSPSGNTTRQTVWPSA